VAVTNEDSAGCLLAGHRRSKILDMTDPDAPCVVSAARDILADADAIFELIADPAQQPVWDGNDNLASAPSGQRVRTVGDVFTMELTRGSIRENHVVEFQEARLIAWRPAEPGLPPPGHLWRWTLEPIDLASTRVTHSYDWTDLADESRFARARATTFWPRSIGSLPWLKYGRRERACLTVANPARRPWRRCPRHRGGRPARGPDRLGPVASQGEVPALPVGRHSNVL